MIPLPFSTFFQFLLFRSFSFPFFFSFSPLPLNIASSTLSFPFTVHSSLSLFYIYNCVLNPCTISFIPPCNSSAYLFMRQRNEGSRKICVGGAECVCKSEYVTIGVISFTLSCKGSGYLHSQIITQIPPILQLSSYARVCSVPGLNGGYFIDLH